MRDLFIVFDTNIQEFWQNRILDREQMSRFPGATVLTDLAEAAQKVGYRVATADVFLSQQVIADSLGLMLTEMVTPYTDELLRKDLIPAINTCAESPIIAYEYYHNIARYAGRFEHAFLFAGAETRLSSTQTQFHPFLWPNSIRQVVASGPWSERQFLTLINSNKRAFQLKLETIEFQHPLRSILRFYRYAKNRSIRNFDPWMRSELYVERLRAIKYFSYHCQFDLYGRGWDTPVPGANQRYARSVQKSYRGTIPAGPEAKLNILQNYRFALCFENTAFPGYITEKLFDCFFAGTIPIYYGAPDIATYVPEETFIDFRKYRDYNDLGKYLETMGTSEAKRYCEAATDFLASSAFDKFHAPNFVEEVISVLDEITKRHA